MNIFKKIKPLHDFNNTFIPISMVIAIFFTLLAGCATQSNTPTYSDNLSATELYATAYQQLNSGNYYDAINTFNFLEARYPFDPITPQVQLELIYSYFKSGQLDSIVPAVDRFMRLNPANANLDYAYYMKGVALMKQNHQAIYSYLPIDTTVRFHSGYVDAFNTFNQLIKQFPNSVYVADAQKRMIAIKNSLAAKDLNIALYYYKRNAYIAAVNRSQSILQNFQHTPSAAYALNIMAASYQKLKLNTLADQTISLLKSNFPGQPFFNEQGKFISITHIPINQKGLSTAFTGEDILKEKNNNYAPKR